MTAFTKSVFLKLWQFIDVISTFCFKPYGLFFVLVLVNRRVVAFICINGTCLPSWASWSNVKLFSLMCNDIVLD